jgi:tRNA dimethylallyltransferase
VTDVPGRPFGVAVVGATATGKSALAESLAAILDAEIVCCDSRQVFAELEIGTGKPSPGERAERPHHLFEALSLGAHASAGWFARAAGEACLAIRARGRLPLLVGGSGLYLRALREGLSPIPPHDPAVRERLRAELASRGTEALHARLSAVDPATAGRVAARDRQRIVRALEVAESTGHPLSWWHARTPKRAAGDIWRVLEVVVEPAFLRERIAARTSAMFAHGLIEEVGGLIERGLAERLRALRAIGYDEALELLAGRLGRHEAEARVNVRTARLAKRQRTWFRHQVEATRLVVAGRDPEALAATALECLRDETRQHRAGGGH